MYADHQNDPRMRQFSLPFFQYFFPSFQSPMYNPYVPPSYPTGPQQGPNGGYPGTYPPYQAPAPGGQPSVQPPSSPPPSFVPEKPLAQTKAVDPGAIRSCLYRYTYIWTERDSFWFYPVYIGRNSISGFRWQRQHWIYMGMDLQRIQMFQCY